MRYQDITFVDFQFSHIFYEIEDVNNGMLIQRQRFELAIKPLGQCVVTGARCCLIYACAVSEPLISSHFEVIFSFDFMSSLSNEEIRNNAKRIFIDIRSEKMH